MANKDVVCILGGSCTHRNKSSGLENLIESSTIYYKVFYYRESRTAPRFNRDGCTIFKMAHKELAGGYVVIRTMCTAINIKRTCSTYTFTAVMVERNRIYSLTDQLLVENVEHFQEGCIRLYIIDMIDLKMSFCLSVTLTPYLNIEIHTRA